MKKYALISTCFSAALLCATACATTAQAQTRNSSTAIIPLPYGVDQLIADDAHSTLLAVASPDENGAREVREIKVRHIYPGAIARIFGGQVIPTEVFAGPTNFRSPFGPAPFGPAPLNVTTIGSPFGFSNPGAQNASRFFGAPIGVRAFPGLPSGAIQGQGTAR